MAKGKYRSVAEAREAREHALRNVAALTKENERLRNEVAQERDALKAENARLAAEIYRLRGQVEMGASDALVKAKASIAELQRELQDQPTRLGMELAAVIKEHDLLVPANKKADAVDHFTTLAGIFGIPLGEFFAASSDRPYSRDIRRMTARKAHRNVQAKEVGRDLL